MLPPKFEYLNDKGEWVSDVKNPQHLDVARLRIGNPECTATVQDALTVREMIFKAFGEKILELYNMTKDIRDSIKDNLFEKFLKDFYNKRNLEMPDGPI